MQGISLDIDYKKLNIDDCFKNHYSVPDYQREYVWEHEQVQQLLADIQDAYGNAPEKPYFMGMIVVYRGNGALELIDGQQRITTFFIFLCALIKILDDNKKSTNLYKGRVYSPIQDPKTFEERDAFVLELQYAKSSECLKNIFYGEIPGDLEQDAISDSDRRLYEAYLDILKDLEESYTDINELMKFGGYFFNNVQFVQIEAKDISEALKIFETINQRGVGLNSMDLLKNMIFMQVDRNQFSELNTKWKKIMDRISSIDEKPLRFLRYYITSTYDISDETGNIKGILPEDQIYKWLTSNDKQCDYKNNPVDFVDHLANGVDRYINYWNPSQAVKGNNHIINVKNIAGTSYRSYLVMLLAAVNMDDTALAKYKQVLESLIYYATVNKVKGNETEKLFAGWCPEIRKIVTIENLEAFVDGSLKPIIDKWKTERDHHRNFMSLNLKTIQVYRIRFILSRISKYVDDRRSGGKNYADVSSYYDKKYQIEHIMPQKCMDPSLYEVTTEDFEYVDNLLGNLTLLEKSFNASIQAGSFEEKAKVYAQSCFYLTESIVNIGKVGKNTSADELNKELQKWDKWDYKAIIERQEMLYRLSEEIWSLDSVMKM
ncbi:Protein of unknown function [Butyrivibrio sp. ob235]|uniref:DUF262 domain-containing protein n=1 Tax=Butyrivibrio sp. ob235 TaxID=1761780 RepID=UPI0008B42D96|nr:DUF262 domain-containing protein [Butyrivibrio sp. ob235]SEM19846.1 Protein of unknown function [Butyrivibrio sp. ob235]